MPRVLNLPLFGPRREIWEHELTGPNPAPGRFIPVRSEADDAAPPADILRWTRYEGDPHLELEEWLAARR